MIFIIEHIHHLMNKFKILIFIYNTDGMMYIYKKKKEKLVEEDILGEPLYLQYFNIL